VVSDLNTFAHKGCKIAVKKKRQILVTSRIFLVSVLLSALVERCFVSRMPDFKKTNKKCKFEQLDKLKNILEKVNC
jgi:hypothetical protein